MVQDFCLLCFDTARQFLKDRNKQVLQSLNIPASSDKEKALSKCLSAFYQDNAEKIFSLTDDLFQTFCASYKKKCLEILSHIYNNDFGNFLEELEVNEKLQQLFEVREEYMSCLESLLLSDDFKKSARTYFSLCIYMLLNDPPLKVPIDNFKNRKFLYKSFQKSDFVCIDGFAKEGSPAMVILPSVMRNNQIYFGIKASVIILSEEFLSNKISKKLEEDQKESKLKELKKIEEDTVVEGNEKGEDPQAITSSKPTEVLSPTTSALEDDIIILKNKTIVTLSKETQEKKMSLSPRTLIQHISSKQPIESKNPNQVEIISSTPSERSDNRLIVRIDFNDHAVASKFELNKKMNINTDVEMAHCIRSQGSPKQ